MDFRLLQDAFEAVINSHYKGAVGKIALRLVECPAICSKALNLLSQLCPYSESDSGNDVNSVKQSAAEATTTTPTTAIFYHFRVRNYSIAKQKQKLQVCWLPKITKDLKMLGM